MKKESKKETWIKKRSGVTLISNYKTECGYSLPLHEDIITVVKYCPCCGKEVKIIWDN